MTIDNKTPTAEAPRIEGDWNARISLGHDRCNASGVKKDIAWYSQDN